jgi:hypothetical protein
MILAHQGGWDEMLFVAIPIGLFAFLLYVANKRAQAQLESDRADRPERGGEPLSDEAD